MRSTQRKLQATATINVALPLIKKDGSQATGLSLLTLSTKIIKPDGTALAGYTEAAFTEPNSDGVYNAQFPFDAAIKAFTLEDQANPYTLTLDSDTADVEPTTIEIWVVSRLPQEAALDATVAKESTVAKAVDLAVVASYIDTEITTLLDRLGAFTGSGVNTVLGFFKSLLRKDAAIPSDIGGTFDPSTDSTEALAEKLTTGVRVDPVDIALGVIRKKITITNGETIPVTRGDTLEAGDITFNFGSDWDCTGREVWFCVKKSNDGGGARLIDVKFTLTDAANAVGENPEIDLQALGLAAGEYHYEFERVLPDGGKPGTPKRGKFVVEQDIRN